MMKQETVNKKVTKLKERRQNDIDDKICFNTNCC